MNQADQGNGFDSMNLPANKKAKAKPLHFFIIFTGPGFYLRNRNNLTLFQPFRCRRTGRGLEAKS